MLGSAPHVECFRGCGNRADGDKERGGEHSMTEFVPPFSSRNVTTVLRVPTKNDCEHGVRATHMGVHISWNRLKV